jgi:hypothetical protein
MGLDMYAARRLSVRNWDDEPAEKRYSVTAEFGGNPVPGFEPGQITAIEEDVMQWRKANHIHDWFVDNVQDGNDDCGRYHVYWEKLAELFFACQKVIEASELVDGMVFMGTVYDKDHPEGTAKREAGRVIKDDAVARDLLPTTEGFFFGSEEYDEWYLQDVIDTRDWLKRMFDERDAGVPGEIYYSSSW